jgi:hypothetical protein
MIARLEHASAAEQSETRSLVRRAGSAYAIRIELHQHRFDASLALRGTGTRVPDLVLMLA